MRSVNASEARCGAQRQRQIVYAVLDPDKPQPAEAIAERVADDMSAGESWAALQELDAAGRTAQVMGGWTRL